MEIYLTKVGRHVVQKKNVELASRLSRGILKIKYRNICLLSVDNDAEEMYSSMRKSLQDL